MSKTDAMIDGILSLEFINSNFADIGDATGLRGSSTAGNDYLSLHTADPGVGGAQNTSEVSYTNYARVAVPRSSSGWTLAAHAIANAALVAFPIIGATAGSAAVFLGIGTASSGAGVLRRRLACTFPVWATGLTPTFPIGAITVTEA